MNVLKYKKSIISPKKRKRTLTYNKIMPPKEKIIENFIGKYDAFEKINSVELKHKFKDGGF